MRRLGSKYNLPPAQRNNGNVFGMNANTPVIIGVGQSQQRPSDPTTGLEPIDLLDAAALMAVDDSEAKRDIVADIDTIGIVGMVSWPYPDPAALLADRLGAKNVRRTVLTTTGGNSPEMLLHEIAHSILRGDNKSALIGGAECIYSRRRAMGESRSHLNWTTDERPLCPEIIGDDRPGNNPIEIAHHADMPTSVYPLLETALRAAASHTVDEHQKIVSELWAKFSAVAATNPDAWLKESKTASEIRTVSASNRMIDFPYPKLMCANIIVDQAAAVIICSYEAAQIAGVPEEKMVFPLSGSDAHDHYFFSERDRLDTSPAIKETSAAALTAAGIGIDDVARFDLYSCFPAAVQISMGAMGLGKPGDTRPLTLTGGLGFAGGPANNYSMHAIAKMVEACRTDPASIGLVHALGWYATKHSVGLYSTTPPKNGYVRVDPKSCQNVVNAQPSRTSVGSYSGEATIESTSVPYDREGEPEVAIITLIAPDGSRVLANTTDKEMMDAIANEAQENKKAKLTTDGKTTTLVDITESKNK